MMATVKSADGNYQKRIWYKRDWHSKQSTNCHCALSKLRIVWIDKEITFKK